MTLPPSCSSLFPSCSLLSLPLALPLAPRSLPLAPRSLPLASCSLHSCPSLSPSAPCSLVPQLARPLSESLFLAALSLSLSLSLSPSLSLELSRSRFLSPSLSLALALALSVSLARALSGRFALALALSVSDSVPRALSLALSLSRSLARSLARSLSLSFSLSISISLSLSLSVSLARSLSERFRRRQALSVPEAELELSMGMSADFPVAIRVSRPPPPAPPPPGPAPFPGRHLVFAAPPPSTKDPSPLSLYPRFRVPLQGPSCSPSSESLAWSSSSESPSVRVIGTVFALRLVTSGTILPRSSGSARDHDALLATILMMNCLLPSRSRFAGPGGAGGEHQRPSRLYHFRCPAPSRPGPGPRLRRRPACGGPRRHLTEEAHVAQWSWPPKLFTDSEKTVRELF
jgi:hypothetical protein